jgi:glycogen phosphorylase
MKIISVTPEIALDEFPVFAGGLGILEGDKFYSASQAGVDYTVITLLYRGGYAEHEQVQGSSARKAGELVRSITGRVLVPEKDLKISIGQFGEATVRPMSITRGSAKVVYLDPIAPWSATKAAQKLYHGDSQDEEMLKYAILAKASSAYICETMKPETVKMIDLQESLSSLALLALPKEFADKARLIMHTPGPWGHPSFSGDFLWKAFEYSAGKDKVSLTELALSRVNQAFAVSRKHHEVMQNCFSAYKDKIGYVTNGVDLDRWSHPEISKLVSESKEATPDGFSAAHWCARNDLVGMLRQYKPEMNIGENTPIISWSRRTAKYKRPYMVERLIWEAGKDMDAVFVLSGKAHANDGYAVKYAEKFKELSDKNGNVVFINDYDISKAKAIISGSDMFIFTPFSGWEACGTSPFKAGINGVPTLSARDGGTLEIIEHGRNGWFFGRESRECIDIETDSRVHCIDEDDYSSFKQTFLDVMKMRKENPAMYKGIMLETMKTFREKADIMVALEKYGIVERNENAKTALSAIKRGEEVAAPQKILSINA